MLNIYDDIIYKSNMYMILIICEIIELCLCVVFNGRYVMYDTVNIKIRSVRIYAYARVCQST